MSRFVHVLPAVLLGACALPSPGPSLPLDALHGQARFARVPADASRPGPADLHWWRRFDDPALAHWVERALDGSIDVALARERLVQAGALLRQARAQRGVVIGAGLQVEGGSGVSSDAGAGRGGRGVATIDWDADLAGGLRLAERSAAAGVMREVDRLQAARLGVAATTARAVIEWREAAADAALLADALGVQRQLLDVARVRVDAGLSPQLDAERARAEIAGVEAEAARAGVRRSLAADALLVLAGAQPGLEGGAGVAGGVDVPGVGQRAVAEARPGDPVPALRGVPPSARPIDLVRLRPDLRAAEQALVAAAADAGVARSALLPRLRLSGTLALVTGNGLSDAVAAGIAAVLDAVLYDGGERRAVVDAADSRVREATCIYRATLLQILQEVAAALAAAGGATEEVAALRRGLVAADAAVVQAQVLYGVGLTGLLDVLDARRIAQSQRRRLVVAQAIAARQAVATFEALGLVDDAGIPPVDHARADARTGDDARADGMRP